MKTKKFLVPTILLLLFGSIAIAFEVFEKPKTSVKTNKNNTELQEETSHKHKHGQKEHKDDHSDHDHGQEEHKDDHGDHDHDKQEKPSQDNHNSDESHEEIVITKEQQEEIQLKISTAQAGELKNILSFIGEIRINEDRLTHVVPQLPGIVERVFVSLGQEVQKGSVLATINSHELIELKAAFLEQKQNSQLAKRTFERKNLLRKDKIASEADWLEAKANYNNSKMRLLSTKRRLVSLGIMTEKEVDSLQGHESDSYGPYKIIAPISGTVIMKHITQGEKIENDTIFSIADLSQVWVDFQIPSKDLWNVKNGDSISINSPDGNTAQGIFSLIGPIVNEKSRSALGRVLLANPDGTWMPGLFVNGQIFTNCESELVVVPSDSIQSLEGKRVVFLPDNKGFISKNIVQGHSNSKYTEIVEGLKPGEKFVSNGAYFLKSIVVASGSSSHAGHGH